MSDHAQTNEISDTSFPGPLREQVGSRAQDASHAVCIHAALSPKREGQRLPQSGVHVEQS